MGGNISIFKIVSEETSWDFERMNLSFKCVMIIIKISLPDNVLDPLRDEDEEEEEEEVGGGVADELEERLPHHLVIILVW